MKKIPLSGYHGAGKWALVDDEDFVRIGNLRWYLSPSGYAMRTGPRPEMERLHMHRVVNNTPNGMVTDHINGNRLDNRKNNLRTASKSQNQCNSAGHKDRMAPYKGISYHRRTNTWVARVQFQGKRICAGYFKTPEEASEAYGKRAIQIQGDFACQGRAKL